MSTGNARLIVGNQEYELKTITGSESETAIDIRSLRQDTGLITLDSGYANTGSCQSSITFINGEEGILRHRGYRIEDLAARAQFSEVCYLLIHDKLPNRKQLDEFDDELVRHTLLHEGMKKLLEGFPATAHPMAILSAMVAALSAYYPETEPEQTDLQIVRLLAKARTIAAFAYKRIIGQPYVYPRNDLNFVANFLHMMFAVPAEEYVIDKEVEQAMNMLLILHADHEQNCSTSTVRMVGSSGVSLYASVAAGISALWGPLHGGANQKVIEMLQRIQSEGGNYKKFVEMAKDKDSGFKLMGFGHRVYKNFDPRSRILKDCANAVLRKLGVNDPLLDIAKRLEEAALEDEFFLSRNLYPNVDFYSGIIYRAMGIPTNMFTVMFALGRLPGWIAHWKEMMSEPSLRICRPRQIYVGETEREFVPIVKRR